MYNYKIGDRVLVKSDPEHPNSVYTITKMPDGSDTFGDHYQGIEESDSTHPWGLFPESDILGHFTSGITKETQFDELNDLFEKVSGIQTIPKGLVNGPVVTKNDQVCYFDVDQTLVTWLKKKEFVTNLKADYYGQEVYLQPYEPHIRFLKAMKARGGHIVVQSGNGWAWAEQVVRLLKLEAFVDEIKTKPYKIVDDSPYENWMPTRIFIEE